MIRNCILKTAFEYLGISNFWVVENQGLLEPRVFMKSDSILCIIVLKYS
jgi:hypothetical protein